MLDRWCLVESAENVCYFYCNMFSLTSCWTYCCCTPGCSNVLIGSFPACNSEFVFVCFRRGLNPPHRVKSISMTTFTQQEIEFLQKHSNEVPCTLLGFYKTALIWSNYHIIQVQDNADTVASSEFRKSSEMFYITRGIYLFRVGMVFWVVANWINLLCYYPSPVQLISFSCDNWCWTLDLF